MSDQTTGPRMSFYGFWQPAKKKYGKLPVVPHATLPGPKLTEVTFPAEKTVQKDTFFHFFTLTYDLWR